MRISRLQQLAVLVACVLLLPGPAVYLNYLRIIPGMGRSYVEYLLLVSAGSEIDREHVTQVVDHDQPVGSPNRLKRVVEGDQYMKWRSGDTYILVAFRNGYVSGKFYWTPSL